MSLCIYSGSDTGFEEKEALLTYVKALDQRLYLVIRSDYFNRANYPPIPVLIYKLRSWLILSNRYALASLGEEKMTFSPVM